MARPETEPTRQTPRIYLLTPTLADDVAVSALVDALRVAGRIADVAAVLLKPGAGDGERQSERLRPVVAACHEIGAACLVEGNTALAAAIEADGAHLDSLAALKGALPALRPHGIAGVGGLRTKHDAMSAGESGADYVMFGEPDNIGRRQPFESTLERADWWVQLFEPPCVAYAQTLEEVDALVLAGADFIAVSNLLLDDPENGARTLAARLTGGGAS